MSDRNGSKSLTEFLSRLSWLPTAYAAVVLIFLAFPLVVVVPVAFSASSLLQFPPSGYSLRWFDTIFSDGRWLSAFNTSLLIGVTVSLISTSLGLCAAIPLTRATFIGKSFVNGLLMAPLMMPIIIVAIALYSVFVRLGINGTFLAVVAGHTVICLPYCIVILCGALREADVRLERAAIGLGAHPAKAFCLITLPLIAPSIFIAALFAFLHSFDEVVIANFVTGPRTMTLPRKIWDSIQFDFNPTIAAVSVLLIVMSTSILLLTEYLRRRFSRTPTSE
ncbi:ABC transporter permease [Brucella sp. NBRC 12950]|uniref:ABC transporter permease n=1 Tax=Brucella sp. NBRC 12950 TaxID=2994518 RepID=UPI0024A11D52|nr:ABC transporter permease [Brucella sp. NBRC 12950]GLU30011.1 ABC transporter permease [Brucella sp. NBRC 12950]